MAPEQSLGNSIPLKKSLPRVAPETCDVTHSLTFPLKLWTRILSPFAAPPRNRGSSLAEPLGPRHCGRSSFSPLGFFPADWWRRLAGLRFPDAQASCGSGGSQGRELVGGAGRSSAAVCDTWSRPVAWAPQRTQHGARGRSGDASPRVRPGHIRGPEEDEQAPGNGGRGWGRARWPGPPRMQGFRASQVGLLQGHLRVTAPGRRPEAPALGS